MEGVGRIYLDTNVFIAAFEAKTSISENLIALFASATMQKAKRFVTSELTLAELLVLLLRNDDTAHVKLYSTLFASSAWLDVQPLTREVCVRSAGLRASMPRKLSDSLHLATSLVSGCTHLLSQDNGIGPRVGEQLPITALRPDEPTLTSLIESLSA